MIVLLGLSLVVAALGAGQTRRPPPEGWPWGIGVRLADPQRVWSVSAWAAALVGGAGAVACLVALLA